MDQRRAPRSTTAAPTTRPYRRGVRARPRHRRGGVGRPARPAGRRRPGPAGRRAGSASTSSPSTRPAPATRSCGASPQVAAEVGVPVFVHGRYSDDVEPGTNADTLAEILQLARDTGCSGARRAPHLHRRHLHHGRVAGHARSGRRRRGHRRHRVHVPLRLLGHLPRLGPLRRGLAGALPHHLRRPRGRRHRRAAHRGDLPGPPGRQRPRRRLRHPRGRRGHVPAEPAS